MDNRFGVKDFFSFLLLGIIVLGLALCLVQYDRQWDQIQALKNETSSLKNDLTQIRGLLGRVPAPANGAASAAPATGAQGTVAPPGDDAATFKYLREAEEMEGFARGDWLVDNFGTNIKKVTPIVSTDIYANWVQNRVLESLAYRDPQTFEFLPLLATAWEISPDGRRMTFDLRQGVVFSDGQPFTADDVVFTFEWIKNPEVAAARARSYFEKLERVEKLGDYRVVFHFTDFYCKNFESVATSHILPRHFFAQVAPAKFNEAPGLLMGSGPYRLATPDGWSPGQGGVELLRNERYWGPPPTFNRLVFREVQEEIAIETLYRNRQLDVLGATPEQFKKLVSDPRITSRSHQFSYYSPIGGYTYVGWNQRRKDQPTVFADKRVRQAMTMLLDRERLANEIYEGFARPASGPFFPDGPQSAPEVKPWPFDPARAAELLREAGFADRNNDGVLEDAAGNPLRFQLTYSSGNQLVERIVLFFQDSFKRGGVLMDLDAVDWPVLLDRMDRRDFDAMTLGWSASVETDPYQMFHSSQAKDNGDNRISYVSPALDAALEAARSTVDEQERMKRWHEVHRILHEDQPYTFLLNRQALRFLDQRVRNIQPSRFGLNYVRDEQMPIPWFVPTAEQLHTN